MKKEKVIAASAVILLIISFIITVLFYNSNKSLTKNLNKEKLKTEFLLSEKLALQKEVDIMKARINSTNSQNALLP
jgi:peptidoglycan hydrolase CwlO-like protein